MKQIVSVSRRTDIPAFYSGWFLQRMREGFAGYRNPYSGKTYLVSLAQQDVTCFVFWSKNFVPFMNALAFLANKGYKFLFNFTITGLGKIFEPQSPAPNEAIECARRLSDSYSPVSINLRYDPIILSDRTPPDFHIDTFARIAESLEGYVTRAYTSFVFHYGKVRRNFGMLRSSSGILIREPDLETKQKLALQLSDIASSCGMVLHSCSDETIVSGLIKKAHCIDGDVVRAIAGNDSCPFAEKPTRKGCGCIESADIGEYDTCPSGCVYCYASSDHAAAAESFRTHDIEAPFLGHGKKDSDEWTRSARSGFVQAELWQNDD
jgi:hypothetical protein